MKLVTVLGARPQFIKAAALSRALGTEKDFEEKIIHTGQHYDVNMSDIFFEQMDIPKPSYHLGVQSARHGEMTGMMLTGIEEILLKEKPDMVVVYGDTNSTLAGSLAAKKLHIPIAHVEAGLRSFNMKMPEEVNRILTDRISDFLFCPSENAVRNLQNEGLVDGELKIVDVGDIMKDVAIYYRDRGVQPSFDIPPDFLLVTIHRAENTDSPDKLSAIIDALNSIAQTNQVIFPVHPRTKKHIMNRVGKIHKNILMPDPVGYLEMVFLLTKCRLVITDSGGLQKEAFYFQKCCITAREETEWVELVESGCNILTGADKDKMVDAIERFQFAPPTFPAGLYGSGDTSRKIIEVIKKSVN